MSDTHKTFSGRGRRVNSNAWVFDGYTRSGAWEPLEHFLARGVAPHDYQQQHERILRPQWFKELAEHGFTAVEVNFSKGFGIKAEEPIRERARRMIDMAHEHGLKAFVYTGDTMIFDSFVLENPDAAHWRQIAEDGKLVTYGGNQTHRHRGCFNNVNWRAYHKELIRIALEDLGADGVHPDNDIYWPEPGACRCRICVEKFREFLKKRYPTPQKVYDRFGRRSVEAFEPPVFNHFYPPWDFETIKNPLWQEWMWFKCATIAEWIEFLSRCVHEIKPDAVLFVSLIGVMGINAAWTHGVDHDQAIGLCEMYGTEEAHVCGVTADGRVISKVRTLKVCRMRGVGCDHNTYSEHEAGADERLMLAESMAFNQGMLGNLAPFHWGRGRIKDPTREYLLFASRHREDLCHVEGLAEVAILRNSASLAYYNFGPNVVQTQMEQALLEAHIIFDIILDRELVNLDRYKVLVLADARCLSDEQIALIEKFVEQGGRLLVTDQTACEDEWGRSRSTWGLEKIFGQESIAVSGQAGVPIVEANVVAEDEPDIRTKTERRVVRFGKGMAAYIADSEPVHGHLPKTPNYNKYYTMVTSAYLHPLGTFAEIGSLLEWLGADQLKVSAPRYAFCELLRARRTGRVVLHIVNYHSRKPLGDVAVDLRWNGKKTPRVTQYGVGCDEGRELSAEFAEGRLRFAMENVDVHAYATIE